MASYFTLILDTTAPTNCSIAFLTSRTEMESVPLTVSASGATQMKFWGDIAEVSGGAAITEANASWVTYDETPVITLTGSDGTKTVYAKFRDSVGNESSAVSATIVLDTSVPTVTIIGPDVSTISKVNGFNVCSFSFSSNEIISRWTVRVVPDVNSGNTAGTEIPTTAGSTNMSGTTQTAASTPISCTINGRDLYTASSSDGAKIIKVFVCDLTGNWSI